MNFWKSPESGGRNAQNFKIRRPEQPSTRRPDGFTEVTGGTWNRVMEVLDGMGEGARKLGYGLRMAVEGGKFLVETVPAAAYPIFVTVVDLVSVAPASLLFEDAAGAAGVAAEVAVRYLSHPKERSSLGVVDRVRDTLTALEHEAEFFLVARGAMRLALGDMPGGIADMGVGLTALADDLQSRLERNRRVNLYGTTRFDKSVTRFATVGMAASVAGYEAWMHRGDFDVVPYAVVGTLNVLNTLLDMPPYKKLVGSAIIGAMQRENKKYVELKQKLDREYDKDKLRGVLPSYHTAGDRTKVARVDQKSREWAVLLSSVTDHWNSDRPLSEQEIRSIFVSNLQKSTISQEVQVEFRNKFDGIVSKAKGGAKSLSFVRDMLDRLFGQGEPLVGIQPQPSRPPVFTWSRPTPRPVQRLRVAQEQMRPTQTADAWSEGKFRDRLRNMHVQNIDDYVNQIREYPEEDRPFVAQQCIKYIIEDRRQRSLQ